MGRENVPRALQMRAEGSIDLRSIGGAMSKRLEDLKDVLTPQDIATYLGISRRRVYEYCQLAPECGGIKSYNIGASRKIDKADLLEWKDARKRDSLGGVTE